MRALFLSILFILNLYGEDALLLNAHMRLIPKIMYLCNSNNAPLVLGIVYSDGRKSTAEKMVSDINTYYKGEIADRPFKAIALSVNDLKKSQNLTFIYFTKMDTASVIQTANWSLSNNIPTFSYDLKNLEHGVLGTISIERNAVIYLNKDILKSGKFQMNKSLLEMAKLI